MTKFAIDFSSLDNKFNAEPIYKYAEIKDKLVKVAFDVVKFNDSEGIDGLWQIKATDDGEVIVAMYDEDVKVAAKKDELTKLAWSAVSDRSGSIHVFYKDEPVVKFAAAEFGIDDVAFVVKAVPEKLAENKTLRKSLLTKMAADDKKALLSKYPELSEDA